jgi:hypothetical protein
MFKQIEGKKLIGRGAFTKCYDNGKTVLLVSNCPVKECNALGWLSDSRLFPKIERLDSDYDHNSIHYGLYQQEKFQRVKSLKNSLKPSEYNLYLKLMQLKSNISSATINCKNQYQHCDAMIETIQNFNLHKNYKTALLEAIDGLRSYTHNIGFEVSPRNVAVKNGKLILLDVFFSIDQLRQVKPEWYKK